jgi:hypothetical protein
MNSRPDIVKHRRLKWTCRLIPSAVLENEIQIVCKYPGFGGRPEIAPLAVPLARFIVGISIGFWDLGSASGHDSARPLLKEMRSCKAVGFQPMTRVGIRLFRK